MDNTRGLEFTSDSRTLRGEEGKKENKRRTQNRIHKNLGYTHAYDQLFTRLPPSWRGKQQRKTHQEDIIQAGLSASAKAPRSTPRFKALDTDKWPGKFGI